MLRVVVVTVLIEGAGINISLDPTDFSFVGFSRYQYSIKKLLFFCALLIFVAVSFSQGISTYRGTTHCSNNLVTQFRDCS